MLIGGPKFIATPAAAAAAGAMATIMPFIISGYLYAAAATVAWQLVSAGSCFETEAPSRSVWIRFGSTSTVRLLSATFSLQGTDHRNSIIRNW